MCGWDFKKIAYVEFSGREGNLDGIGSVEGLGNVLLPQL